MEVTFWTEAQRLMLSSCDVVCKVSKGSSSNSGLQLSTYVLLAVLLPWYHTGFSH